MKNELYETTIENSLHTPTVKYKYSFGEKIIFATTLSTLLYSLPFILIASFRSTLNVS